jgi:hypothetical protein
MRRIPDESAPLRVDQEIDPLQRECICHNRTPAWQALSGN